MCTSVCLIFASILIAFIIHEQTMLIYDLLAQDTVSESIIGILSGSILGEAQQIQLTGLALDHLEEVIELFSRRLNATLDTIDEADSSVSHLQCIVLQYISVPHALFVKFTVLALYVCTVYNLCTVCITLKFQRA